MKNMLSRKNGAFCLVLVMLVAALSVMLTGCSSEPDPNLGTWEATTVSAQGVTMDASEVYGEHGFVVTLDEGGDGIMSVMGTDYNVTWSYEGDGITIIDNVGDPAYCVFTGEEMIIENMADQGIDVTFQRGE